MVEKIGKYRKVKRKLQSELNRDPLPEEIADEMEIDVAKVNQEQGIMSPYEFKKRMENDSENQ